MFLVVVFMLTFLAVCQAEEAKAPVTITKDQLKALMEKRVAKDAPGMKLIDIAPDPNDAGLTVMVLEGQGVYRDRLSLGDSLKGLARNLSANTGMRSKVILKQPAVGKEAKQGKKPVPIAEVVYDPSTKVTSVKFH